MSEQTQKLLEALAARLGTTADYLWHILVRQARISAVEDIAQYVLIIVFAIVMFKVARRTSAWMKDKGYEWYECMRVSVPTVIGCAISALLIVIMFCSVPETITKIVNPEYYALCQIMSLAK